MFALTSKSSMSAKDKWTNALTSAASWMPFYPFLARPPRTKNKFPSS